MLKKCFKLNLGALLPLHTAHFIYFGGHAEQQLLHSQKQNKFSAADFTLIVNVLLAERESILLSPYNLDWADYELLNQRLCQRQDIFASWLLKLLYFHSTINYLISTDQREIDFSFEVKPLINFLQFLQFSFYQM